MLLVAGASGFLGRNLTLEALASVRPVVGVVHHHPVDHIALESVSADLTTPTAARALLRRLRPATVVNCAAFADVDACEANPERARLVNVELPRSLAVTCAELGVGLVHISTDSVFDGTCGGYTESDKPAPVNVYARSKLEGERAVQDAFPEALIIRTNFIGASGRGAGLADWVSSRLEAGERIGGFADVIFSPLLANELARVVLAAIDCGLQGLYHASAGDACSKYEFACRLAVALGVDTGLVKSARLADAKLPAPRPLNTSMSSARLEAALGRQMPSVDAAISGYVALRSAGFDSSLHERDLVS
ncbi:MAG TPA: SDR family oxidoreductase [Gemmatimonadaceae bacterium]|nr:SDR family oxidoreductase [Gemmatimonadaceae bacterium]